MPSQASQRTLQLADRLGTADPGEEQPERRDVADTAGHERQVAHDVHDGGVVQQRGAGADPPEQPAQAGQRGRCQDPADQPDGRAGDVRPEPAQPTERRRRNDRYVGICSTAP